MERVIAKRNSYTLYLKKDSRWEKVQIQPTCTHKIWHFVEKTKYSCGRDKVRLYLFDTSSVNIVASTLGFLVNIQTSSNLALVPHTIHCLINLNMFKAPKKERAKHHSQV